MPPITVSELLYNSRNGGVPVDQAKARKKLAELEQKIEEAEARVRDQELLVRALAVHGPPTAAAEVTLQNLKTLAHVLRDLQAQFKKFSKE